MPPDDTRKASLNPLAPHEMLGAAVRALLDAVLLPEQLLGQQATEQLRGLDLEAWYPGELQMSLVRKLHALLGDASLRQVGWSMFAVLHDAEVRRRRPPVHQLLAGLDVLYRRVNRGTHIGGWELTAFGAGSARLAKTTPHDCIMEEGIVEGAFRAVGIPVVIRQPSCVRQGAARCELLITSSVVDRRWTG